MTLKTLHSPIHLHLTSFPQLQNPSLHTVKLRLRKRQRLKVTSSSGPFLAISSENLFHSLISVFPSVNSLDLIGPALGFASGAAVYLSTRRQSRPAPEAGVIGDWILFTSPTPFNRSVLLRCPSVAFEDGGERLMKEDRHYVNLSRGRIPADRGHGESISYQRLCVGTADGGVISLDWPDNLDLKKEYGLDTTVLLVPGTAEGSMDRNVTTFVSEALKNGCFPIVMNPRGCAGSPLTTPRLFTAADSDDICTAIEFINRSRPWTTLTSVGWGYGANMLTKYLTEVGERTPLTAAVCIDNPFDLEEATRSFPHYIAMDQKLTGGLIDILRANKELFQGKTKGFNVEKALSATSVREFEGAVSMMSYGFEDIEEFYSKSSTRHSVGSVKVPLLFIQSDDGTVPLFSIPRSAITQNPYTSLVLCSCLPLKSIRNERSTILWCQHLAVEWLSAVELALLKGRHPLLKDVDLTINPSKGLTLIGVRALDKSISDGSRSYDTSNFSRDNGNEGHSFKLPHSNVGNELSMGRTSNMIKSTADKLSSSGSEAIGAERVNGVDGLKQTSSVDAGFAEGEGETSVDIERSQMLETASVVLKMLDATMPGTLGDEHKRKVLTAMEQGETLMKALQGAVPEDVQGKLTAAVSEIAQTQGSNLNLDRLKKIGWIPNMNLNMNPKIQEESKGILTVEGRPTDSQSSDPRKSGTGGKGKMQNESFNLHSGVNSAPETVTEAPRFVEEVEGKSNQPNNIEKVSGIDEAVDDGREIAKDVNKIHYSEVKSSDGTADENMPTSSINPEEAFSSISSSPDSLPSEKEGEEKNEDNNTQDMVDQNLQSSKLNLEDPPSNHSAPDPNPINVSQALEALTGFDDSTQMAVNSVFGVIQNMIDQYEKETNQDNVKVNQVDDQESGIASQSPVVRDHKSEQVEDGKHALGLDVLESSGQLENNTTDEYIDSIQDAGVKLGEKKIIYDLTSSVKNSFGSIPGNNLSIKYLVNKNSNEVRGLQNIPLELKVNTYMELPYKAYLQRYLSSQKSSMKSLDLQSTTDLFLDPEEGRWKMLHQMGNGKGSHETKVHQSITPKGQPLQGSGRDKIIEPSYIILDSEQSKHKHQSAGQGSLEINDEVDDLACSRNEELMCLVKNSILNALKVEVGRKLGMPDMKQMESNLANDLEQVADVVSRAVIDSSELASSLETIDPDSMKLGRIQGQHIIKIISSAVQGSCYLGKVLPVGVIVGSCLASIRKYFHVTALHTDQPGEAGFEKPVIVQKKHIDQNGEANNYYEGNGEKYQSASSNGSPYGGVEELETVYSSNDGVMIGAATAALSASALTVNHQIKKICKTDETVGVPSASFVNEGDPLKEHDTLEDATQEKTGNYLMSSLAEKAMSVAGPVVPTKNDGEVDHDRLVTMLAELGQKGGMLSLIGKVALLWGGIRGAMSLTDRLISFSRIAGRPLFQRILGFVCMVLVLWSPVVMPLLPTLVQSLTTKSSMGIAGYICIIGLYVAIMILVMLWGKRIRGYDNSLEQYGLDLTSAPKAFDCFKGLMGGALVVLCIHSVNALLGYAYFARPPSLPSTLADAIMLFKTYGTMLILTVRGIVTATGIAVVEELLFRSWLFEEIAVDFGYHRAIFISGFAFSIVHRSLSSIPALFLLSLALFGAKERHHGSLSFPIGARAGIMTVNFVLQTSGFLTYRLSTPFWLTSTHPWHPFDGLVGLSFCTILAIFLYPGQTSESKSTPSVIQE